ncbi:MAG: hypothetical protein KW804_02510, partial [Candidatus Doudnabacteria bacterium]|nr:hypothetical protein [Candidatus Doudnabacteria bacterium]
RGGLLTHFAGGNTDTVGFGLSFQQLVKKIRPDVTILTPSDIHPEVDKEAIALIYGLKEPKNARYHLVNFVLKQEEYKSRPIYTTYLVDDLVPKPSWTSVSNGLVYKFYENSVDVKNTETLIEIDMKKDRKILESDLFGKDLISQYDYAQGAYWIRAHDLNRSQGYVIDAIKHNYFIQGIDYNSYISYRNKLLTK